MRITSIAITLVLLALLTPSLLTAEPGNTPKASAHSPAEAGTEAPSEAPIISPSELSAARESGKAPVVIDVRTASEFATGHVPGALNIPFDVVADRISEVQAPNGVVLYCMLGPRARKGEAALLAAGYASVQHLDGGLAAWLAAGLPIESHPDRSPAAGIA